VEGLPIGLNSGRTEILLKPKSSSSSFLFVSDLNKFPCTDISVILSLVLSYTRDFHWCHLGEMLLFDSFFFFWHEFFMLFSFES
jgi:hypothetical protein